MYEEVWQTWSFVVADSAQAHSEEIAPEPGKPSDAQGLRQKMQTARLHKRLSIWDLADKIGCTAETLSAFERGTEILDQQTQQRIRTTLDI